MAGYRFLEGVVTADLAFEAVGKDLNDLFTNAALAVFESQAKLETVEPKVTKKIVMENEDIGQLLFEFLNEIIFFKDAEQLIFKTVKVAITKNKAYKLVAELKGEKIDPKKHKLGNDLKAVTMHMFSVEETPKGWKCRVVIDI
ncbi:MAG: archease [Candidatus Woesearchaeota archaeon]